MAILDRYLLKQYVQVFFICMFSLTGLYVVIDGFTNLEEFINYAEKAKSSLLLVMAEFYAYQSLTFFDRTCGTLTLVSAMFTVTWIQRHNELTAIEAAGIPKARVIRPLIAAAILIGLVAAANREIVIPQFKDQLSLRARDLAAGGLKSMQPRFDSETKVFFQSGQLKTREQTILKPNFVLPQKFQGPIKQLSAEEAVCMPADGDRPAGYLLKNLAPNSTLDNDPTLMQGDRPVLITPRDGSWLQPGQCFLVSNVDFDQLEGGMAWKQFSSTYTLVRGLRNGSLNFAEDVRMTIHARIVQPLLDMTLLFLGLPLVLGRGNRNMFVAIGMCLAVTVGFMLVVLGCQYLGTSLLIPRFGPAEGAWLPLLIFVPVAVGLAEPLLE